MTAGVGENRELVTSVFSITDFGEGRIIPYILMIVSGGMFARTIKAAAGGGEACSVNILSVVGEVRRTATVSMYVCANPLGCCAGCVARWWCMTLLNKYIPGTSVTASLLYVHAVTVSFL